jgi:hypothetical protein
MMLEWLLAKFGYYKSYAVDLDKFFAELDQAAKIKPATKRATRKPAAKKVAVKKTVKKKV